VTPEVRDELETLRRERMAIGVGAVLLFPSVNDPTVPLSYKTATQWLRVAEKLAGLDALEHGAFTHSAAAGPPSANTSRCPMWLRPGAGSRRQHFSAATSQPTRKRWRPWC
jgi:hypothetical protein